MPAVARGSELLKDAPDKAATLLLDFPAAPYTAFLVDVAGCAECFQQHCLRLAEGLHLLSSAEQLKSQTSEVWHQCLTRLLH